MNTPGRQGDAGKQAMSGSNEMRCEACGKTFHSQSEMREHERECTGMSSGTQRGGQTRGAGGSSDY